MKCGTLGLTSTLIYLIFVYNCTLKLRFTHNIFEHDSFIRLNVLIHYMWMRIKNAIEWSFKEDTETFKFTELTK